MTGCHARDGGPFTVLVYLVNPFNVTSHCRIGGINEVCQAGWVALRGRYSIYTGNVRVPHCGPSIHAAVGEREKPRLDRQMPVDAVGGNPRYDVIAPRQLR